jgi:hypothetical protein
MPKRLNKLLAKLGLRLVKVPAAMRTAASTEQALFPEELLEKVVVQAGGDAPDNELFRLFAGETDVLKWHHYFEIYTRHLAGYRDRPIRMLEIGVFRGGSLRMWKRYFHPESIIVGIDVDESCRDHEDAQNGIFVRIGDQADRVFLSRVAGELGPFDIILDDGSHKTYDQISAFNALFRPALADGGCYLLEDMHSNYWVRDLNSPETFIRYASRMVDALHEPYLSRRERDFRRGDPDNVRELEISYLSANLAGVFFYDSVVVLEKRKRQLPTSELR